MAAMGRCTRDGQRTDGDAPRCPDADGVAAQADSLEQVRAELRATEAMLRKRLEQDKLKVQQSLLPPPPEEDGNNVGPYLNRMSSSGPRPSSSLGSFTSPQPSSSFVSSADPTPPSGTLPSSSSPPSSNSLSSSSFLPFSSSLVSTTIDPSPPTTPKPTGSPEPGRSRKTSTSSSGSWSTRSRIGIDMLLNDTESRGAQLMDGKPKSNPNHRR